MNRPVASFVLAGIVALAACSGSDGQVRVSGPDPVTVPSSTDALHPTEPESTPPATDPEPTSPATDPGTTSTSTIITTPTTTTTAPAPTTTLDPVAEIEAAVKQARLDASAAFAIAEADPTDLTLRTPFADFMTGDRLRLANEDLDQLAADGLALRPGDPDVSRIVFEGSIELPDGVESTEAFLNECLVNSDVLYVVETEDRPEAIIDDGLFSFRNRIRYILEDGRWKHAEGTALETVSGRDAC